MTISKIIKELSLRLPATTLLAGRVSASGLLHKFVRNRGRLQSKACMAVAGLLLVFFMLTGLGFTPSLPGLAAGQGLLRDNRFMARLSLKEEARYVSTLADLLRADPRTFLRMVEADVKLLLDEPDLRRADGPVTLWQYRSDRCVLDVYLSAETGKNKLNDTMRVVDYEARPRLKARMGSTVGDNGRADDAGCFDSVLAAAMPAKNRTLVVASLR